MAGRWLKEVSEVLKALEGNIADLLWLERHLADSFIKSGDELDEIALNKLRDVYREFRDARAQLPGGREWTEGNGHGDD